MNDYGMSLAGHCPECEAAWERGHKAGRAFQVAQGTDNWKAMHAVVAGQVETLDEQLLGAVETLERIRDHANSAEDSAVLAQNELNRIKGTG